MAYVICTCLRAMILLFVVVTLVFSHGVDGGTLVFSHGVDGVQRKISRNEYLELKRHLKFLNRPAVKSIKTEDGEIFDCVDINKQPAFDHLLLKNHTVEMRPSFHSSSYPKIVSNRVVLDKELDIHLQDGGCPQGFVPIRRTRMQDLLRATSLQQFGKKYPQKANSEVINVIFSSLVDSADAMDWGGKVNFAKKDAHSKPLMKSGHNPFEGYGKSCFIRKLCMSTSPINLKTSQVKVGD